LANIKQPREKGQALALRVPFHFRLYEFVPGSLPTLGHAAPLTPKEDKNDEEGSEWTCDNENGCESEHEKQ